MKITDINGTTKLNNGVDMPVLGLGFIKHGKVGKSFSQYNMPLRPVTGILTLLPFIKTKREWGKL